MMYSSHKSRLWSSLVFGLAVLAVAQGVSAQGFYHQYADIKSVHLEASAVLQLIGAESERVGHGKLSYWEQGEQYRIRCETDRTLNLFPDVDIAFDGYQFQYLDRGMDILSVGFENPSERPTALPNPLFLVGKHLTNRADCLACNESVADVAEGFRQLALQQGKKLQIGGPEVVEVVKNLATRGAITFKVHSSKVSDRELPVRIEEVAEDGTRLLVELSDFTPAGKDFIFPRNLSMRAIDPAGQTILRVEFLITTFEVNQGIEASTFVLEPPASTAIWDIDASKFLRN